VTVDCPLTEPETMDHIPLDTNAADAGNPLLPEGSFGSLGGSHAYVPTNTGDGWVDWSWRLTRR